MKKKWLALVPAIVLAAASIAIQPVDAASETEAKNKQVQLSEPLITPNYSALFEWAPKEQPILQKGPQKSFEVEFLQVMLNHFGFDTNVDGIFGPQTDHQVRQLQEAKGLAQDGVVGVNTWTVLLDEYGEKIFSVERAIHFAEEALNNDDLVFSRVSGYHEESDEQGFYKLRAQSQELIDGGGSGTVGFYDVYTNGDVVESEPN
ncbi:peptidoglycan-binding domain-containing protein [Alkalihalobacillus sp. 1P02AB]|uniref:peptidoglycan-binding domain-containing protein n=1 Tax=Alkalihalobacillus sp. 1P02AB TaxID=3132260 RepID=UPI0039A5CFE0